MIFSINHFIYEMFTKPKTRGVVFKLLVCPTNSRKPQNIQFTMKFYKEKQQILTIDKI